MSDARKNQSRRTRVLVPLLGIALLVFLVTKVDRKYLALGVREVGWGIFLVIALAGVSHLIRTWAWRLVLHDKACEVSFAHTLGLRLVSEAVGQFGFLGMIAGDMSRMAMLGGNVPVAYAISSVTLDRCLFIATGAVVTAAGIVTVLVTVVLSHVFRFYAVISVMTLGIMLITVLFALRRRWPVLSATADVAARIPRFQHWSQDKRSALLSAETRIADFYREYPGAFWGGVILNLVSHFLAIAEVYLILFLLKVHVTLLTAFILESLTKLINVVGTINPGNLGTYEGGNMVIVRLVHMTSSQGLTLALCRRLRAAFWAIIGTLCLIEFSRSTKKTVPASVLE